MAQTLANLLDVTKEVWTSDRLEKQFYDENRWLDKVERTNKYTIGRKAIVPVHTGRSGGFTVLSSAGGTLNPADEQKVDSAEYTLSYNWFQVALETAALAQADSVGSRSAVDAADLEVEGAVSDLRRQMNRQFVSNGDALIAQCAAGGAATEVELSTTGYGFDAIERGWLYPGLTVDIGTTADEDSIVGDATITAVEEVAASPSITIDSSVTTTTSHYVSIAKARAGTTSYEMNGLRNIVGSTTSVVGGIDPATASYWKPAYVDTTTTTVSLDLLLTLSRKSYQKAGKYGSYVTTSPKQLAALYALFQNQVRFDSDGNTSAGNVEGFTWNGLKINQDPDIPDRELYVLNLSDFIIVTGGGVGKPTWASDIEGAGGQFRWAQGTTSFVDGLVYPAQLGVKSRRTHAAAIGLTA